MIGYPHNELQLVGRILFRIELGGSFTTKTQSAQRRKKKNNRSTSGIMSNTKHCLPLCLCGECFILIFSTAPGPQKTADKSWPRTPDCGSRCREPSGR